MSQSHNQKFYEESIDTYGISAQGVHWNSEFSQYKRFEILTEFIREDIKSSTLIDVGCGMGEYYNYLMDEELKPKNYMGIDCEQKMIDIAAKRYPRVDFILKNVLEDELPIADYYICSGAMNILEVNEFYLFILNCYEKCEKGFVFNFLKKDSYTKVYKEEILTLCHKISNNVQSKDNYLDNDFSIFISK